MHKILLVEDDQVIRQQVGKLLSVGASFGPHGYRFATL